MSMRSIPAAVAALVLMLGASAPRAEGPEATPIETFADAMGVWNGMIDYTKRVSMGIHADGTVEFNGPRSVLQKAELRDDRILVKSPELDLDCGLMNDFLVCHARFDTWYAELNLRKKRVVVAR